MLYAAILAVLLHLPAVAPPTSTTGPRRVAETLDVRYFPGKDRHTLDVFRPEDSGHYPVVLFVHGGTWMIGDKDFYGINRRAGRMLARAGYVAVLINYRLSPFVKHPEHARDVARAFAWAHRNIARFGGDASRIVLMGHSAGGHLATLVASDPTYLADPALKLGDEARRALRGVVGISGVYRIPGPDEFKKIASAVIDNWTDASRGPVSLALPLLNLATPALSPFKLVFGEKQEVIKQASPLAHARKGLPPFLLLYSEAEPPTLDEMAVSFTKALLERGTSAEVRRFEDCNHRTIMRRLHDERDVVARTLLLFLRNRLDNGT